MSIHGALRVLQEEMVHAGLLPMGTTLRFNPGSIMRGTSPDVTQKGGFRHLEIVLPLGGMTDKEIEIALESTAFALKMMRAKGFRRDMQ